MREIPAAAHFFLLLRPGVTKLEFIAVSNNYEPSADQLKEYGQAMNEAYNNVFEEIKRERLDQLSDLSNTRSLFSLCNKIVDDAQALIPHLTLDEHHIRAVAVQWLEQETLSLGDTLTENRDAAKRWRSSSIGHAQLRFQDAIDWYATYNCSLINAANANDSARYKGYEQLGVGCGGNTILKVPMSASRPKIVTLSNLKVFLAEHLLAFDQYAAHMQDSQGNGISEDPGLTFFFLPVKGLGQYRAAMDWVGFDGYKRNTAEIQARLCDEASKLQRLGLESLFTQSLIRSFSVALRQAFFAKQEGEIQPSEALSHAFADLWWANEVRFKKVGQIQYRLLRAEGEEDTTWLTATDKPAPWKQHWHNYSGAYTGFFATSGNGHPEQTFIKLNLSSFANPSNDVNGSLSQLLSSSSLSYQDLTVTINALPFDEIVFACYFFEPLKEDLAEWVDQLADTIVGTLMEQTIQRTKIVRSRAKTLERAAHWLNGLVRLVGRVDAAETLAKIIDRLDAEHDLKGNLERVYDSLELLVLVEAGTGLLRLYGTLDDNDFEHVRDWFTETSRDEWMRPTAFQKYHHSITHLARAITSASGYPRIDVMVDGDEISYADNIKLELDNLRFPPLSKAKKGNEPILALLPALTEPLDNAIKYLKSKISEDFSISDNPIKLVIEDRRVWANPCILVEIGNPYFEGDELPATPGLSRARELVEFTGLATIGDGRIKTIDGKPYYFVPVYLHPQNLAGKTGAGENSNGTSGKKAQASNH